jgi:hypothetical protein
MARDAGNTDGTLAAALGDYTSGLKGDHTIGAKGNAGALKDDALMASAESVTTGSYIFRQRDTL